MKETIENVNWFFPLHPVSIYRNSYVKQKTHELVSSLFDLQNMFIKFPFLVWSFESGNCGKKKKKQEDI